ncbi:hypothetical protein B0T21DRAFT_145387 [Apiosordaria backusii]|uniref:Secreted protein n=1 Tax=Apiosordaria backusii TaxID=314023 RepID=A0AA40BSP3_9PEZI|nr:hypothetical protein B0T21DRAFT_145387 [Apiosordaria backusii]
MRTLRCILLRYLICPPVLHHLSAEREEKYQQRSYHPLTHNVFLGITVGCLFRGVARGHRTSGGCLDGAWGLNGYTGGTSGQAKRSEGREERTRRQAPPSAPPPSNPGSGWERAPGCRPCRPSEQGHLISTGILRGLWANS